MGGRIQADTSNMQVLDFTGLLLRLNENINYNTAIQNKSAVHGLINQLDNLLDPYKDGKYNTNLEEISKISTKKGRTSNEQKALQAALLDEIMTAKYRALLRLAYRKRFLPSASSSSDMYGGQL